MESTYKPLKIEEKIYKFWSKEDFFNPDKLPGKRKKNYTIAIPPPNITGSLHMGHALNVTCQDILIRWKRMQGFRALWLPGTDHAGIATQNAVEKQLKKEGLTRFDLGREKFLERVWQWKEKYGDIILNQFKKLGCSCDWSRTRFTMDEDYVKAVETAFSHYYKKGWIYQGERTINWCTRCSTSLSDLEVVYREEPAEIYYINYGPITVATVRPETKLGDTAVAVNPKDPRYKKYIGKAIDIKTVLGPAKMKVIGDTAVDMNFGTGAMKVTPAHDIHDFELGEKHGLEKKQVIGPDGRMTKLTGKYSGMTVMEARQQVVEDMKKIGILKKIEPYTHNVARCYRCNTVLEPILSKQWFLKMEVLAKKAERAVKTGRVKFIPKRFEKPYFDWLKNIKDWCVSRQIWWGHKIPLKGVEDVLDTWFSSALWPFAILGWPPPSSKEASPASKRRRGLKDLKEFYPTTVLSTDRGIINLWVARMIFSGLEFMGKPPFEEVFIHPTVLTREGKRMSKSLGTGVDPLNLIERYGADATRFGIAWQITGSQDIHFVEDNIMMGRKFCNKIWNATRFLLQNIDSGDFQKVKKKDLKFTKTDKWILSELKKTIKKVDSSLGKFQFYQAERAIYHFFWHKFCDKTIEDIKKRLRDTKSPRDKLTGQWLLYYVLLNSLKLLHPFMPFLTEEIYQMLPKRPEKALIIEEWPRA